MTRFLASVLAAALLASCSSSTASFVATPAANPPPASTLDTRRVDRIVQAGNPNDFGISLGIYKNGKLLYQHGYGFRDFGVRHNQFVGLNGWGIKQPSQIFHLKRGRFAPDANTVFDLGSVSKEFTGGSILLLQQDGKISVHDKLSKYFPNIQDADKIPLLYLLQHRTGFVDYNGGTGDVNNAQTYAAFMASGQKDYATIVDHFAELPSNFVRDPVQNPPGSYYYYSNTDYLLLGVIVARVSHETLGDFLQQRIFGPLGMASTHQGYPPKPVDDFSLGYQPAGAAVYRAWQWNLNWLAGPGGLTSIPGDIEKWDLSVRDPGGIFTRESLKQMFTTNPLSEGYADGWVVTKLRGHRFIWHNGEVGGFQTMNATFPDDGIDIVILTNNGGDAPGKYGYGFPYDFAVELFPVVLAAAP
jgi:CubicO group peptidase (beta-lactamase class C family)